MQTQYIYGYVLLRLVKAEALQYIRQRGIIGRTFPAPQPLINKYLSPFALNFLYPSNTIASPFSFFLSFQIYNFVKMADFNAIAQQFVQFYYQTFDGNRAGLAGLYRDQSMLTFETSSVQGVSAITEKLGALPFQKVQHQIATFDAQPSSGDGIVVLVTGALLVDEEQKPMNYTQCFKLQPDGAGSYFVLNDVFRLIYSAQ
ncbi:hypothetical protein PENPOL_c009G04578 [Penicillium polonicum]|uniref:Nuclear transport factor 2 n=3 Tax=Penicillium TaxID=5073 RepID=A0A1V6NGV1_PENPO|nr:hypothetical protein PENPOL_c009G04578 [Penicillium polonicum]